MKIGLMSFAHPHVESYASILRRTPGVEILASDPLHSERLGETGGAAMAAAMGVDHVETYAELLAWGPDAVIVCSENARHREDVLLAASSGAHVLCEKPLALATADADAMIAACDVAGVNLMVAYPVRFAGSFSALRSLVDAGGLGTVRAILGTNNGRLPGGRRWFTDPVLSGGGALTDHTVHVADLVSALLPDADAREVFASTTRLLHPDATVDTAGLVSVSLSDGTIVSVDCSWSKPAHFATWGGLTLSVLGDEGSARIDPFVHRVDGFRESTTSPLWLGYGDDLDAAMIEEFLASITESRRPTPDGGEGRRSVAVVEAAIASVRDGVPVRVTGRPT